MLLMKRVVRNSFGVTSLLLAMLATGCIPIPVPNSPENHWQKPASKLRVGQSDQSSVLSSFGKPGTINGQPEIYWDRSDPLAGKTWEYYYNHLTGYELCLIPGPCNPFWSANYTDDLLTISFDDKGRLTSYTMRRIP